ncbi:hypothetical protein MPTK1_2g04480 [Marchantia polymorpha subsp. ruderalis]|uniref:Uncharacterized protein n=1 Tax=Marchantia polymorpha TaxID=3197 RepID=A0A2R6X7Q1_MARPO|nr:hypothetical protein MARPO_0031s0103 [Marchantia polymorpha]BBN01086.1 hypothetical protein Mp_2g04480 [Marchantia polymorpha subsp. ruderalis]|eukprot:PTQ42135.1 hypothetical protein MARPO_0031s0103 [Marchantia polymorpha]
MALTGCRATAFFSSASLLAATYSKPSIATARLSRTAGSQTSWLALYGQASSVPIPPLSTMNWKARSTRPAPSQPESLATQSRSSCSDSETSDPVAILLMPSTAPVAENAQPLPHRPWSFTPVTAPCCRQSTSSGSLALRQPCGSPRPDSAVALRCSPRSATLALPTRLLNSSRLMPVNRFSPSRYPLVRLARSLCSSMYRTLALNTANRSSSPDALLRPTPCVTAQDSYNARNSPSDSRSIKPSGPRPPGAVCSAHAPVTHRSATRSKSREICTAMAAIPRDEFSSRLLCEWSEEFFFSVFGFPLREI